ncbi:angio-associated migratory cell protein [Sergentomyia squamirostris]
MGSDNSPNRPPTSGDNIEDDLFNHEGMEAHDFDGNDDREEWNEIEEIPDIGMGAGTPSDSEDEELATRTGDKEEEQGEIQPIRDDAIVTFREHTGPVFCARFHPTEPLAVTGSEDDTALVWNTITGDVVHKCDGHTDTVIGVGFSYDGTYLATADLGGFLQAFRVTENYKQVWSFNIGDMAWMEWHRASNVLMAGSESGEVYFWRIPSGDCKVLQGHNVKAECGSLTADAKKIAVGYVDGCVKLWDIKTTAVVLEIPANSAQGHTEGVISISTDSEGSLFASGGSDGQLVISSNAGPLGRVSVGDSIESVAFCPLTESLKLVATGTLKGRITIWDVSRQSPRCECQDDEPAGITKLLWANNMNLLTSRLDGSVKIFDGRCGQLKSTLLGHRREIYDMHLDKTGQFLLTVSEDGTAKIFRMIS